MTQRYSRTALTIIFFANLSLSCSGHGQKQSDASQDTSSDTTETGDTHTQLDSETTTPDTHADSETVSDSDSDDSDTGSDADTDSDSDTDTDSDADSDSDSDADTDIDTDDGPPSSDNSDTGAFDDSESEEPAIADTATADNDSDSATGTGTDTDTDTDSESTPDTDSQQIPATDWIYQGCRSPEESDCFYCCEIPTEEAGCVLYQQDTGDTSEYAATQRPCPELCFPCARCLASEDATWRTLNESAANAGCDCGNVSVGIDPCFSPGSCECICQQYETLAARCDDTLELTCAQSCPDGYWPQVDGTPSCACIAPLNLIIDSNAVASSLVSLTAESSLYVGGIDKLMLLFTWQSDDAKLEDDEINIVCQVVFELSWWPLAVSPWNTMTIITKSGTSPAPFISCSYYEYPTADAIPMTSTDGFISLRQSDNALEGYVSMTIADLQHPGSSPITVSGPYHTPVPEY
ncbi:MAG: hypothetical protein JXX14_11845 [Deltaproteobacteria bacterium]|nr:hypothetical protein [Deltaproteobacteria bacterium]